MPAGPGGALAARLDAARQVLQGGQARLVLRGERLRPATAWQAAVQALWAAG